MIILDTDIVTLAHAEHPAIARHLAACQDENVAITIISVIEIMRGRFDYLMKAASKEQFLHAQELLQTSASKLEEMPTIFLDEGALAQFESLHQTKGLKKLGRADLLIASIALARDATLISRNVKHFRLMPRLRIENWVD